ncbi:MAG: porin [Nitrospirae bacterium]|nr:porin [Nitrospirota bacterium]MDA1304911.1 porin [Nitrospirota bacterium]
MRMQHRWIGAMALGSFMMSSAMALPAFGGDVLTEVLREKGVISKEDWIRIEADREKQTSEYGEKKKSKDTPAIPFWSKKGFGFETEDGNWRTSLQWRFQGRFTYPERGDPDSAEDFGATTAGDNPEATFELRRVRMKIGGHGHKPWIKYYFEVDLQSTASSGGSAGSTRVIDWRIDLAKYKEFTIRVGQWKINYNRERVDSSGKQTFVERSIVNSVFTIDRQVGVLAMGRLFPGKVYDVNYYIGVFTGSGRGEANDDDSMMYMARIQWNIFGRELKWSQSDVEYHEQPTANLAFGGYTNIGKCTRWSSSGCGTLVQTRSIGGSFTLDSTAVDSQFRTEGLVEEFAMKWKGLAIQHEFHWKQVKDAGKPVTTGSSGSAFAVPSKTNLMGSYTQVGYFPHYLIPVVPKPLEVAFRYAFVDPNVGASNDTLREYTMAFNWFFAGHRNKLTADFSHLSLDMPMSAAITEQRGRLQWDVSF